MACEYVQLWSTVVSVRKKVENYSMIPYNTVPYMAGGIFLAESCRIVKFAPLNIWLCYIVLGFLGALEIKSFQSTKCQS